LKVLVVDDDDIKSGALVSVLARSHGERQPHSVTVAKTLTDAVRVLNRVAFDLIVLDLMLPYLQGGQPDSRAGLELVRQLRSEGSPNAMTHVIGISAFPDEVSAFRANFDRLGVLIVNFDDEGAWRDALLRTLDDVQARAPTQIELDFLIICALEEERKGYESTAFDNISRVVISGLNVQYVRLPGTRELFGGIVRLGQIGLVSATFETTSALNVFRTTVLCMSGICAGFSEETGLGQLVIASPAWEYQAGKWSKNGFEIAPMQVPLRRSTRTVIDQAVADDNFTRYLEAGVKTGQTRPTQQLKPILAPFATGSAVIADERRLKHIEKQHRKFAALDMETFGLYFAAHEAVSVPEHFFSIKCVVDFADGNKGDVLHPYGCVVSARAAEKLIQALLTAT
jgi:adenosylhomocysteine nucleosidase